MFSARATAAANIAYVKCMGLDFNGHVYMCETAVRTTRMQSKAQQSESRSEEMYRERARKIKPVTVYRKECFIESTHNHHRSQ